MSTINENDRLGVERNEQQKINNVNSVTSGTSLVSGSEPSNINDTDGGANGDVPSGQARKLTKLEKKLLFGMNSDEEIAYKGVTKDILEKADSWEERSEIMKDVVYNVCDLADGEEESNPITKLLRLYRCCPDCKNSRSGEKTVAELVLEHFGSWLEKHDGEEIRKKYMSESVKKDIVEKAIQTNNITGVLPVFFPTLLSVWDQVKEKLQLHHYDKAMRMIDAYTVNDSTTILDDIFNKVVLPYYFRHKLDDTLKNFLRTKPTIVSGLVSFLDQFTGCDANSHKMANLRKYMEALNADQNFGHIMGSDKTIASSLEKNLKELGDNFVRDEANFQKWAPNYTKNNKQKRIRFIVRTRFDDVTAAEGLQTDMTYFQSIIQLIKGSPDQINRFICDMWRGTQEGGQQNEAYKADAIRWYLYFEMEECPFNLPRDLLEFVSENPGEVEIIRTQLRRTVQRLAEQTTETINNLRSGVSIEHVRTADGFIRFLDIFENAQVVAMDSEFSQDTGFSGVCLMQLSIDNVVYLIDFCAADITEMSNEYWERFLNIFFYSSTIVIGYDILNDINQLFRGSLSDRKVDLTSSSNVVCLKRMAENIYQLDPAILPLTMKGGTYKLADLSAGLLNKPMPKGEQIGCWNVRPLRRDQIYYAANDAYVVGELYDTFKLLVTGYYPDKWDELIQHSSMNYQREKHKHKKEKISDAVWTDLVERLEAEIGDKGTVQPTEVKILADVMQHGLGKYLRRFGMNVIMARDKMWTRNYLRQNEDRFVITTGKAFDEWGKISSVIDVSNSPTITSLEQLALVFKGTNAYIRKSKPFYRCMECNERMLLTIPSPVIGCLYARYAHLQSLQQHESNPQFEIFPFDEDRWIKTLQELNPAEYDGISCIVKKYGHGNHEPDWMAVRIITQKNSPGCIVNITKNLIIADSRAIPVQSGINKIPENAASRPGILFYACAYCGRLFYDGKCLDSQAQAENAKLPPQNPANR